MRLFHSLATHLSFTAVAKELHLSQSGVSIQIKRLAESVGTPLIEKIGKKIYLTDAGKQLFAATDDVLNRLEMLNHDIQDMGDNIKGPLNISGITTSKYFMPKLLGKFLKTYPDVEPSLTITNQSKVIQRMRENLDDIYMMGKFPLDIELEANYFLDNPLVLVAPVDHPLAKEKNIPLSTIAKERFISREEGSGTRAFRTHLFQESSLKAKTYMELGSAEAIKQAIESQAFKEKLYKVTGKLVMYNVRHSVQARIGNFRMDHYWFRYSNFVPRLHNWVLDLGFEKGKIMPSRAFCSDESQGYPIILLAKHFGAFPFNHGQVGGIMSCDRHGPHSHHAHQEPSKEQNRCSSICHGFLKRNVANNQLADALLPEYFTFKKDLNTELEELHQIEQNILRAMPWIVTSSNPMLTAAQANTEAEFDRAFRSISQERAYEGRNLLYISGLNIDISPEENQDYVLTRFVPWAAYVQLSTGERYILEQKELFETLSKYETENKSQVELDEVIKHMQQAEAVDLDT
ncbi:HTH-type transcriptional activator CmpR [Nymphon striatum]|nr:HTH-type transcriptional activator CmpR [Nymphon striatum]